MPDWTTNKTIDHLEVELKTMTAMRNGLAIKLTEVRHMLFDSAEALESIWAAIGDALLSGKGIVKEYSQDVAAEAKNAADKARHECGWDRKNLDERLL